MSKLIFILLAVIIASCTPTLKKKKHSISPRFKLLKENHITLHKGETFHISFDANPSIGYSICWINEYKCDNVSLAGHWYKGSIRAKQGYEGAGGTEFWTFRGKQPGIDTIKLRGCPTGRKQKSCSAFQEDSLSYTEDLKCAPKYHRAIIVRVVER
jgi:predicted secreted protein